MGVYSYIDFVIKKENINKKTLNSFFSELFRRKEKLFKKINNRELRLKLLNNINEDKQNFGGELSNFDGKHLQIPSFILSSFLGGKGYESEMESEEELISPISISLKPFDSKIENSQEYYKIEIEYRDKTHTLYYNEEASFKDFISDFDFLCSTFKPVFGLGYFEYEGDLSEYGDAFKGEYSRPTRFRYYPKEFVERIGEEKLFVLLNKIKDENLKKNKLSVYKNSNDAINAFLFKGTSGYFVESHIFDLKLPKKLPAGSNKKGWESKIEEEKEHILKQGFDENSFKGTWKEQFELNKQLMKFIFGQ